MWQSLCSPPVSVMPRRSAHSIVARMTLLINLSAWANSWHAYAPRYVTECSAPARRQSYVSAGVEIDVPRRRVARDGEEIKLTPKEFELLAFLARHAGKVVTHKQILNAVW